MGDERKMPEPGELREKGELLMELGRWWQGWELDYENWLYRLDGRVYLIASNHGGRYVTDDPGELAEALANLETAVEQHKAAIALLEGK